MPPPSAPFHFAAPVLRSEDGFRYHYLPIPREVAAALHGAGVRRVIATLNGKPFARGLQSDGRGGRFLSVGQAILRELHAQEGDMISVDLIADPEPDRIELGEEFAIALEQDEAAAARFFAMTPGHQRSLASYVTSAKRVETRIKRALDLARQLRTYTLYGDLNGER